MSERVYIIGVGMTKFGKFLDKSIKTLTGEALERVLSDCELTREDVEAAWFANSYWGMYTMQHGIRGQVALTPSGIDQIRISPSLSPEAIHRLSMPNPTPVSSARFGIVGGKRWRW